MMSHKYQLICDKTLIIRSHIQQKKRTLEQAYQLIPVKVRLTI